MTRAELNVALAAVLTTAAEMQHCPETSVYLALGSDMGKWEIVKTVLLQGKLATISCHSISLTQLGRELADKCAALLK